MDITLKNERICAVISTSGAQLMSLVGSDSTEYIWQGDKKYWGGRSPILFPIVGGLRDGKTFIDGKEYHMNRHGFAKISEFSASDVTDSSAVFTIVSTDETRAVYPFDFSFSVKYTLTGDSLTWEYIIENTGDKTMPFAVGGHPAFNCPLAENECFEDYAVTFEKNEVSKCATVNLQTGLIDFENKYELLKGSDTINLKHELFYSDALVFDDLRSRKCRFVSTKSGKGVEMKFDGFDLFGIWSAVNDAPFVCLEPWTGCATTESEDDNFENKRNMIFLKPGEICKKEFTVTVL